MLGKHNGRCKTPAFINSNYRTKEPKKVNKFRINQVEKNEKKKRRGSSNKTMKPISDQGLNPKHLLWTHRCWRSQGENSIKQTNPSRQNSQPIWRLNKLIANDDYFMVREISCWEVGIANFENHKFTHFHAKEVTKYICVSIFLIVKTYWEINYCFKWIWSCFD